jgi:predicted HicB family RNase H-like nuclease
MLRALGAKVREGAGSRVRISFPEVRATLHRPWADLQPSAGEERTLAASSSRDDTRRVMKDYKGYTPFVEYDAKTDTLHGHVAGIRDVVTFEATTVKNLEREFHNSVNDYLEMCKVDGVEPEKPFSGRFVVRVDPELHRAMVLAAAREKTSLNTWAKQALAAAAQD